MSKEKIKQIFKESLGEGASIDQVVDHIWEYSMACGERITAYELKYEFKKEKEKDPKQSDSQIILQLAADYNVSWSTAYRYVKY